MNKETLAGINIFMMLALMLNIPMLGWVCATVIFIYASANLISLIYFEQTRDDIKKEILKTDAIIPYPIIIGIETLLLLAAIFGGWYITAILIVVGRGINFIIRKRLGV